MSQAGMLAFPFGEYRDTEQVLLAQCQREVYAGSERIEQFTDRTNGGYERLLYVHEDLQGNTRYYTKDNGQSFAELTYDAWGMPESPNKLLNNDHGNYVYATYTGHIFDTTLDIYFAEARFYDAQTRQWLAMDPIKSGNNWYQYCYSSPIVYFDPDGENPIYGLGIGLFLGYGIGEGIGIYNEMNDDEEGIRWENVHAEGYRYGYNGLVIGGAAGFDPTGAGYGIASQAISDAMSHFVGGEPISSLEAYSGAALGGVVGTKSGPVAGAAVSSLSTDILENIVGEEEHTLEDMADNLFQDVMAAGATKFLTKGRPQTSIDKIFGPELTENLIESSIKGMLTSGSKLFGIGTNIFAKFIGS